MHAIPLSVKIYTFFFVNHAKGFVDLPLGPSLLDNGLDGLWDAGPRLDKWIHGSTHFGPW